MSRTKTGRQAAQALIKGRTITSGRNTEVRNGEMRLFGNRIAWAEKRGNRTVYRLTLAGWNTMTTRDRLNAVLDELGSGYRIRTRRGQPLLHRWADGYEIRIGTLDAITVDGDSGALLGVPESLI